MAKTPGLAIFSRSTITCHSGLSLGINLLSSFPATNFHPLYLPFNKSEMICLIGAWVVSNRDLTSPINCLVVSLPLLDMLSMALPTF